MIRIAAAWDSGPYGYWYKARDDDYGRNIFEADEALLIEYDRAEKAFEDAQDALKAAGEIWALRGTPGASA